MIAAVKVETRDLEMVLTREVDAPRAMVFKAWTDPEQFAQWFRCSRQTTSARSSPPSCASRKSGSAPWPLRASNQACAVSGSGKSVMKRLAAALSPSIFTAPARVASASLRPP